LATLVFVGCASGPWVACGDGGAGVPVAGRQGAAGLTMRRWPTEAPPNFAVRPADGAAPGLRKWSNERSLAAAALSTTSTTTETNTTTTSTTHTTTTTTAPQRLVAGVFGRVMAHTKAPPGFEAAGRVRIRPVGEACGDPGSSVMEDSVQPFCAGHICQAPTQRSGNAVWWDGVRIIHEGLYRICWCEPSTRCKRSQSDWYLEDCCFHDANFTQDEGWLEVSGPKWIRDEPVQGQAFPLSLVGSSIDRTSRVHVRLTEGGLGGGVCGGLRSAAEIQASEVVEREETAPLGVFQVRIFRRLRYRICWCAGGVNAGTYGFDDPSGKPCTADYEFGAEVGLLLPQGPNTEKVPELRAVAGVPFSLPVRGDQLYKGDRVRVVSDEQRCGEDGTQNDRAVMPQICGRGFASCFESPVVYGTPPMTLDHGPPPRNVVEAMIWPEQGIELEVWKPVAVSTPGLYRLCWCQDTTWDPVRLVSQDGYCTRENSFSVEVGFLRVGGAHAGQTFTCSAFSPCTVLVGSSLPMDVGDEVMIMPSRAGAVQYCGRGALGLRISVKALGRDAVFPEDHSLNVSNCSGNGSANGSANGSICSKNSSSNVIDGKVSEPSLNPNGTGYVASFHISRSGQPGSFVVCYCHNASAGGPCDDPVAFGQSAGTLLVEVASGDVVTQESYWSEPKICDAFTVCTFSIMGIWATQVQRNDAFYAVPKTWSCGPMVDMEASIFTLSSKLSPPAPWEALFAHPSEENLYKVGDYKLCYCTAATLAIGADCTDRANFRQAAGELQVVGLKTRQSWSCNQGLECKLPLPGWRLTLEDKVVVVDYTSACAQPGVGIAEPADDFVNNPAQAEKVVVLPGMMVEATFALGARRGAGRWRICLCSALASPAGRSGGGPCSDLGDFVQDAGDLKVDGALSKVYMMPNQPPAGSVVSAVADVMYPGSLMCAVSSEPFHRSPYYLEVEDCLRRIPGCLGVASLPYMARKGPNLIHVPIDAAKLAASADRNIHIWCVGDQRFCPNDQCAVPADGEGLMLAVLPGVTPWSEWLAERHQAFDLTLRGEPLNGGGGFLQILPDEGVCGDGKDVVVLPFTKIERPGASVTWKGVVLSRGGYSKVCWCDRTYGAQCVLWQHVGQIGVAGPLNSSGTPAYPTLGPMQLFEIQLWGVNLTSHGRLGVVRGRSDCTDKASSEAAALAPMWARGSTARWEVASPPEPCNFTICWGPGDGAPMATVMGRGEAVATVDCRVAEEWEPILYAAGKDPACNRVCGGGNSTWVRRILQGPRGGGRACPPEETFRRTQPCNTQRCPAASVLWSWTEPKLVENGTDFEVLVEGFHFDPKEDAVALVGIDGTCGGRPPGNVSRPMNQDEEIAFSLATCQNSRSSSMLMVCGSFSMDEPGFYRVCICDASELNVSAGQPSRCVGMAAFSLQPTQNRSLIEVVGPDGWSAWSGEDRGGEEDNAEEEKYSALSASRPQADEAFQLKFGDKWAMGGIGAVLALPLLLASTLLFRYLVWHRGKARLSRKIHALQSGPKSEREELVERATRDAWEAYNRTLAEHMNPELFSDEYDEDDMKQSCGEHEYDVQSTDSSLATSWSRTNTESRVDTATSCSSYGASSMSRSRPGTSRPNTGTSCHTSRSLTPPATGGTGRGRTPLRSGHSWRSGTPNLSAPPTGASASTRRSGSARRQTPPRSGASMRSAGSRSSGASTRSGHPSLLRMELPQMASQAPAPVQGGSFLDLPLMGKSVPPPSSMRPPTGREAMVKPIPITRIPAAKPKDEIVIKTSRSAWEGPDEAVPERPQSTRSSSKKRPKSARSASKKRHPAPAPVSEKAVAPPPEEVEMPALPSDTPCRLPTPGLRPLTLPEEQPPAPSEKAKPPVPTGAAPEIAAASWPAPPPDKNPKADSTARPPGGEAPSLDEPKPSMSIAEFVAAALPEPPPRISSPQSGVSRKPPARLVMAKPTMPTLPSKEPGTAEPGIAGPSAVAVHVLLGLGPAGLPAPPPRQLPPKAGSLASSAQLPTTAPLPPPRPFAEVPRDTGVADRPPPTPFLPPPHPPSPMLEQRRDAKRLDASPRRPPPPPPAFPDQLSPRPPRQAEDWQEEAPPTPQGAAEVLVLEGPSAPAPEVTAPAPATPVADVPAVPVPQVAPVRPPGTPAKLASSEWLQGMRDRLTSSNNEAKPEEETPSPPAVSSTKLTAGTGLRAGIGSALLAGAGGTGSAAGGGGGGLRAGVGSALLAGAGGARPPAAGIGGGLRMGVGSALLGAKKDGPATSVPAAGGLLAAARASKARLQSSSLSLPPPAGPPPAAEPPPGAEEKQEEEENLEPPSLQIVRCHEPAAGGQRPAPPADTLALQFQEPSSPQRERRRPPHIDSGDREGNEGAEDDGDAVQSECASAWQPQAGDAQQRLRAQWHARLTAEPQRFSGDAPPPAGRPSLRPGASLRATAGANSGGLRPAAQAAGPQAEGHGFRRRRQALPSDVENESNTGTEVSFIPSMGAHVPGGAPKGPLPGSAMPRTAGQTPNWAFCAP